MLSYNAATAATRPGPQAVRRHRFSREVSRSVESVPLVLEDGALKLHIVVDHCSVEVFAQGGKVVLTDFVFPDSGKCGEPADGERAGAATMRTLTVTGRSARPRTQPDT